MPLEEGTLKGNQLWLLPRSTGRSLPFKGLTRLPNPPQGPNAIVPLLQLCWEAWAQASGWAPRAGGRGTQELLTRGHNLGNCRAVSHGGGSHELSTYHVLGKIPPMGLFLPPLACVSLL